MKRKKFLGVIIVFSILIFKTSLLKAGPFDPNPPTPAGSIPGTEGIPVDGGITILVAAGIGFGIKKIKDARQNNQDSCRQFDEK